LIALEGRVIAGYDEFMLRLGHLSAICDVAIVDGGSVYRFERAVTSRFCSLISVPSNLILPFARYLRVKGLSPVEAAEASEKKEQPDKLAEYRYPSLRVIDPAGPDETVVSDSGSILGQWQDVNLAHPDVASKVGAISFGGRRGSKTGLSHVFDWGDFLGLFNAAGALTSFGQLLGKYADIAGNSVGNPYVLGSERLIVGLLTVREDFDMFATLVGLLSAETEVIRKQHAMQLYVKAVTHLADRAENSHELSAGRRHQLFSLWREVKSKGPRGDQITSTAWHRIAARLENYVDLGLLRKDVSEQYEYKYRITENIHRARTTLASSPTAAAWIDRHLVDVLTGGTASDDQIEAHHLEPLLVKLLSVLARPMSPLPLDVVASGIAALSLDNSVPVTFGTARRSLEAYAVQYPERARLSSGATRSAEYISITTAALSAGER
jgi:hypothetical protein